MKNGDDGSLGGGLYKIGRKKKKKEEEEEEKEEEEPLPH